MRRNRLPEKDITVRYGIRTTTPLRTAFDLATRWGPLPENSIEPLLDAVAAVDALARTGRFGAAELVGFARDHRGARGVRNVADVAALLDPRADSPQESRMRVKVVLAGLPRPVVRLELRDRFGCRIYELDLGWPDYRVGGEYDGRDHTRYDRRWRDVDRHDHLRRWGWRMVTVTSKQLARPLWVPQRFAEALSERGWTPSPDAGAEWAHIMINPLFRP